MALLPILQFPDKRLTTKAKAVDVVDVRVQQLVDDMLETMYDAKGIGLAATQVNVHERVVVMDLSEERNAPQVFINPRYEVLGGEQEYDEGCLSVPDFYETITRHERIKLFALDKQGEAFELEADGLLSVCIQHELDHLEGKLFVDYLSNLKRNRIKTKLQKIQKQNAKEKVSLSKAAKHN